AVLKVRRAGPILQAPILSDPILLAPILPAPVLQAPVLQAPVLLTAILQTPVLLAPVLQGPVFQTLASRAPLGPAQVPPGSPLMLAADTQHWAATGTQSLKTLARSVSLSYIPVTVVTITT
ncbi:hypothetical protein P7K49_032589, partial [Saguinus oedipus]